MRLMIGCFLMTMALGCGDGDADDPPTCTGTVEDLVFDVVTYGDDGTLKTSFTAGETVWFEGRVQNPCFETITFYTSSTCLLTGGSLSTGSASTTTDWSYICGEAITEWIVGPGGETGTSEPRYGLADGDYTLSVVFGIDAIERSTDFRVE